ncbi:hypothetical protein RYX36_024324 [Vicia faba]
MDNVLVKMVSVVGEPIQRLSAYSLEGLRERLESSKILIYKALKCEQPTSKELMSYMHTLPGGPPFIRVTGVDGSQSLHARGGGLQIVGQQLSDFARSCEVPFEFHIATMSGCEVQREKYQYKHPA